MEIGRIFILGNHIQALGISRLGASLSLEVTIFNNYRASVARFSNSCHRFVVFKNLEHLFDLLMAHGGVKDTMIIATNDRLIDFICAHHKIFEEKYFLALPSPDVVQICFNKRLTYQRAQQIGLSIPKTYFPNTQQEIDDLATNIQYPVLLKPAIMYKFFSSTGKKVFLCRNAVELRRYYQEVLKIIPAEEVIVQQFLKGGARHLYSFGSFFATGEVYGGFVANRIRQKPMDFGISTCFAHTVISPEIEELATRFLKSIGYFGLSEVEFMWDEEEKIFKLLEINPRAWKWHSIANKLGINLLEMTVLFLEQKPITKKMNTKAGIGWIESVTDTYVALGEILKGRLTLAEYIRTLRLPKEFATFSFHDPKPAIMYLLMTPYLFFQRN